MSTEAKKQKARENYYKNRERRLEQMKTWRLKSRTPCPNCGAPKRRDAALCRRCFLAQRKGEKHPQWKGGRRQHSDGYIQIHMPDHPRADSYGYVMEHILVWEQANGKPLPKGWIIHHLNGIKDDNRPRNLAGLPNKKHYLLLQAKAKRIQELEAALNGQPQLL